MQNSINPLSQQQQKKKNKNLIRPQSFQYNIQIQSTQNKTAIFRFSNAARQSLTVFVVSRACFKKNWELAKLEFKSVKILCDEPEARKHPRAH